VANASATADEQHGERNAAAEGHGVVTGAARQPARRQSEPFDRVGKTVGEGWVAGRGWSLISHLDLGLNASQPADLRDTVHDVAHGRLSDGVVWRANIECEARRARHRIHRGMGDLQPSDGRHQVRLGLGALLNCRYHDRGGGQSVAPQGHRRCAGVGALANDRDLAAARAADRRDHPDRPVLGFEDRALLDMNFDVADDVFRQSSFGCYSRRVATEREERFPTGNPLHVALLEGGLIEEAGQRARPAERRGKADAFLVAERHDLHGEGESSPLLAKAIDDLNGRHDTEIAVIRTRLTHGVDMRAKN
jgi:hypothetical protein